MVGKAYSKAKGNSWENIVFRDLREIMPAYKSVGSGNGNDCGDIITDEYCIECKFHKKITTGEYNRWWIKIVEEAKSVRREPILITRENGRPAVVTYWDVYKGNRRAMMEYELWLECLREKAGLYPYTSDPGANV